MFIFFDIYNANVLQVGVPRYIRRGCQINVANRIRYSPRCVPNINEYTCAVNSTTVLTYADTHFHAVPCSLFVVNEKQNNLVFVSRRPCFDSAQTNVTSAVMSAALFWCAYTARGTSEYLPITRSWFAAELSQCLDKMADINSVVKQRWCD